MGPRQDRDTSGVDGHRAVAAAPGAPGREPAPSHAHAGARISPMQWLHRHLVSHPFHVENPSLHVGTRWHDQHRLRPAVVVVHLREQQHDVGSPKRCRRPLSRFCRSASKLKCRAEIARPTSSSLRLAAVAQAPVHLCNGDCPPLPRVARDITDSARCRSNVGLGGAITNEIDWPGQILKGHEAGPPSTRTTPGCCTWGAGCCTLGALQLFCPARLAARSSGICPCQIRCNRIQPLLSAEAVK